jgi:hypothetical protein
MMKESLTNLQICASWRNIYSRGDLPPLILIAAFFFFFGNESALRDPHNGPTTPPESRDVGITGSLGLGLNLPHNLVVLHSYRTASSVSFRIVAETRPRPKANFVSPFRRTKAIRQKYGTEVLEIVDCGTASDVTSGFLKHAVSVQLFPSCPDHLMEE